MTGYKKLMSFQSSFSTAIGFIILTSRSSTGDEEMFGNHIPEPHYPQAHYSFESKHSSDKSKLFFPPGSKLVVEPTLELPVVNVDIYGIGSILKMGFPITGKQLMLESFITEHIDKSNYLKLMNSDV
jgi:hypothetical protein